MIIRLAVAILCLVVGACSIRPPQDTAVLPFAAFGTMDNDVAAANQAAWAFAAPERIANNPVDAARAAAAIDYLAGELTSNPRWIVISPLTKQKMVTARFDVRQSLGIVMTVPSQVVVNTLLRFAGEWQAGDQAAAVQALAVPGFTLPPETMVRALETMPYIHSANLASIDAAQQMQSGGMRGRF